MKDDSNIIERITELTRDVEVAKAAYDAKKLALLMYIYEVRNPEGLEEAKKRVVTDALKGLQDVLPKKARPRRRTVGIPKIQLRAKPTVENRENAVIAFLKKRPNSATSSVQKELMTDYPRTLRLLNAMEAKKLVRKKTGKPMKHSGRLIYPRTWVAI